MQSSKITSEHLTNTNNLHVCEPPKQEGEAEIDDGDGFYRCY